ncbi:MAG: DEAD/DEAH box helicase [Puniceicoccaceae bacterium]
MTEVTFEAMSLCAPLQKALAFKGYTHPSPIQEQAIPIVLKGKDLIACAQTGTGKTAAFALPILDHLGKREEPAYRNEIRCLVLVPTRELAVQVADSFKAYGRFLRPKVGLVYGGVSQRPQEKALRGGLDVLVATPGRLIDLMQQGFFDGSEVRHLILDEADRMLDMGFIPDIERILAKLPTKRQTLLFSATMAPPIAKLAEKYMRDPENIRIVPEGTTAENIDQYVRFVDRAKKEAMVFEMMEQRMDQNEGELNLIFMRTKHAANRLAVSLSKAGIPADAIHGNKTQAARQRSLDRFRDGRIPVLVATDVAARGIDVKNITLVINYDLPNEPESYVHRIGRTARAGKSGRAVSFCAADEIGLLNAVEKVLRKEVPEDSDHAFHSSAIAAKRRSGGGRGKPEGRKNGGGGNRFRSGGKPGGNRRFQGRDRQEQGASKNYRSGPRKENRQRAKA